MATKEIYTDVDFRNNAILGFRLARLHEDPEDVMPGSIYYNDRWRTFRGLTEDGWIDFIGPLGPMVSSLIDLFDVNLSNPTSHHVLAYDTDSSMWINRQLTTTDIVENSLRPFFSKSRAISAVLGSMPLGSSTSFLYWTGSSWATETLGVLAFADTIDWNLDIENISFGIIGLNGVPGSRYATLDGVNTHMDFYAPLDPGSEGDILISQGRGAPQWTPGTSLFGWSVEEDEAHCEYNTAIVNHLSVGGKITLSQIYAPTSNGGKNYGYGSSGQVLKSNGSSVYWANDAMDRLWAEHEATYLHFNGTVINPTIASGLAIDYLVPLANMDLYIGDPESDGAIYFMQVLSGSDPHGWFITNEGFSYFPSCDFDELYCYNINGYNLGEACTKSVTDSTSSSAIGRGTNLVTERDVYYGLPFINGSHTYSSSTYIYAPTTAGSSGQVLVSNGTNTPTWQTLSTGGLWDGTWAEWGLLGCLETYTGEVYSYGLTYDMLYHLISVSPTYGISGSSIISVGGLYDALEVIPGPGCPVCYFGGGVGSTGEDSIGHAWYLSSSRSRLSFDFLPIGPIMYLHSSTISSATLSIFGSFAQVSDMRYKILDRDIILDIEDIAHAPIFDYHPIETDGSKQFSGTSAQYWDSILPNVVSGSAEKDNFICLDYASAALISVVSVARHVINQDKRLSDLEKAIDQLQTH